MDEHVDFVTDAELIVRLNLPEKIGRTALRELDKQSRSRRHFPRKDPLFGNRRFWPAVKQWFLNYYSVLPDARPDGIQIGPFAPDGVEDLTGGRGHGKRR